MKYTREERLDIGRRIYYGEIDRYRAAEEYGISEYTARDYMRLYRKQNLLPEKRERKSSNTLPSVRTEPVGIEELESMTKEELIHELVKARITEARLKKGYEVKGDGTVILTQALHRKPVWMSFRSFASTTTNTPSPFSFPEKKLPLRVPVWKFKSGTITS